MTESLRTQLVSLLTTAGVNVRLSEDETEEYPFATYEMTVTPVMNKDGVCKYVGETYIRVISDDFDEADARGAGPNEFVDVDRDGLPDTEELKEF